MSIAFYVVAALVFFIVAARIFAEDRDDKCIITLFCGGLIIATIAVEALETYKSDRDFDTAVYMNNGDKPVKALFMTRRMFVQDYVKEIVVMPKSYVSVQNSKKIGEIEFEDFFAVK